ncbi:hypothetical protein JOC54_002875 [Alkalihalobacillus xiaoxiensis]|uniref:Transposase n=1 Tax=Shouchella xiaoxiensis TaxID=766895 RepID=A0ABS2SXU9_9BACI|nr:hypothetical protein [Shouchella xiaoxiensis]
MLFKSGKPLTEIILEYDLSPFTIDKRVNQHEN